jgi:hypothetical protein
MEPERVDLTAIDAMSDQLHLERLVRRVVTAAGPELERRARSQTALALLGVWARPMLAAAAMVAILAGGVLVATERERQPDRPATVVDALGVPAPASDWLAEGREPTKADLVLAMERRR